MEQSLESLDLNTYRWVCWSVNWCYRKRPRSTESFFGRITKNPLTQRWNSKPLCFSLGSWITWIQIEVTIYPNIDWTTRNPLSNPLPVTFSYPKAQFDFLLHFQQSLLTWQATPARLRFFPQSWWSTAWLPLVAYQSCKTLSNSSPSRVFATLYCYLRPKYWESVFSTIRLAAIQYEDEHYKINSE